ncbi:helix-turn-helix domain-containing protein [Caballeronia grimmiae]|uniref:helix-turn-helix domain-containing protein n=1 Tax=Caballeronia grimmiae TaxID=1071679 RepID=UPI0038BA29C9
MDPSKQSKMKAHSHSRGVPEFAKTWSTLQGQVFLKPIRSEDDYRRMVALANELADHLEDEEGSLADLFGVVTDLIEVWESHHPDLPEAEPKDVLRYLLDAHDLKQKDLADIASPTVISDILAGRRAISKSVAKALAERFGTDISAFM